MKRFLILLLILAGCSTAPPIQQVTPVCRHFAVFGALTWQNLTGESTIIAIGPSKISKLWHAQAAIVDSDYVIRRWLVWDSGKWTTGEKDPFVIMELIDPEKFYQGVVHGKYSGLDSRKRQPDQSFQK